MELIEKPIPPRKPFRFQIPQPPRSGALVMSLTGIPTHWPMATMSFIAGSTSASSATNAPCSSARTGAGKSTLLKILAGVVEFQNGKRTPGHNAKIGYFSQHRAATLDPAKTVLQEVMDANGTLSENEARAILGSFLFRKDDDLQEDRHPQRRRKDAAQSHHVSSLIRPKSPAHG